MLQEIVRLVQRLSHCFYKLGQQGHLSTTLLRMGVPITMFEAMEGLSDPDNSCDFLLSASEKGCTKVPLREHNCRAGKPVPGSASTGAFPFRLSFVSSTSTLREFMDCHMSPCATVLDTNVENGEVCDVQLQLVRLDAQLEPAGKQPLFMAVDGPGLLGPLVPTLGPSRSENRPRRSKKSACSR